MTFPVTINDSDIIRTLEEHVAAGWKVIRVTSYGGCYDIEIMSPEGHVESVSVNQPVASHAYHLMAGHVERPKYRNSAISQVS